MIRPNLGHDAYPATVHRELFVSDSGDVLYGDSPESWAALDELDPAWHETVNGFVKLVSSSIDDGVLRAFFEVDQIVLPALPVQPRMGDRLEIKVGGNVVLVYEVSLTHGEMLAGVEIDLDLGELFLIPAGSMIHVSDLDEFD